MTTEQREAIDRLQELVNLRKRKNNIKHDTCICGTRDLDTVLSLIKEQDKQIDLMAFNLADYVMYYEYDKCRNPEMIKNKAEELKNILKGKLKMLKIKDNVDLKELEKFGFKPKYDENTGQICAYQKKCEKDAGGLLVNITETTSLIRIYRALKGENKIWRINKYNDYFDIDTLYDLIQAGLVEKE